MRTSNFDEREMEVYGCKIVVVGRGIKKMDKIMMRTSKYDEQEMENYKVRGWKIVGCRSRDKRGWMSQQGWMVFPTTIPSPSLSNCFNSRFF